MCVLTFAPRSIRLFSRLVRFVPCWLNLTPAPQVFAANNESLMHEIDSRDLEEAWPDLCLKLAELYARLPPLEATVFEAIVRAAAEDTVLSDAPKLPPDLTENNQPQRDGLTRLLLGAIAQLPSRLGLDQATGGIPSTSGAASEMTARPLVQKLATIATNEAEREGVKILLGTAASSLARGLERASNASAPQAFPIVMESLRLLQPHHERIPSDGTVWRGRPAFLTKDWLDDLQADAAEARGRAIQLKWRALARAGPVAKKLAISQPLIDLVESHAGSCQSTARAAYVFYDSPGHGVYPHVDASSYALTALFMVRHEYRHAPQSHHLHFLADGRAERVDLQPGEMLLFYGGSVVHARTPVAQEEAVAVLTAGFRPL